MMGPGTDRRASLHALHVERIARRIDVTGAQAVVMLSRLGPGRPDGGSESPKLAIGGIGLGDPSPGDIAGCTLAAALVYMACREKGFGHEICFAFATQYYNDCISRRPPVAAVDTF